MAKMFYTLEEAKAKLARSEVDIKQLAREGRLREFRDGPRLMFKADQVDQLADAADLPQPTTEPDVPPTPSVQPPVPDAFGKVIKTAFDAIATFLTKPLAVQIVYTNWKGETAVRKIIPQSIRYGHTEYHKDNQWLLKATDVEKGEEREFAMKDIRSWF